jgi:tetratricopeptide (TPR) repeat protein
MSGETIQVVNAEPVSAPANLPTDTSSFIEQGDSANQRFDHDLAISLYTRAIELNSDDAVAYSHSGATYGKVGRHREALEDGEKVSFYLLRQTRAYRWLRQFEQMTRGMRLTTEKLSPFMHLIGSMKV